MRSIIRQKVINFIFELHSQNEIPLWSIANEKILYTIALDQVPIWGPRQKYIFYIMRLAYRFNMSDVIIFLLGFSKIIHMVYLTKKNTVKNNVSSEWMRVFAGFGAASEEDLYQKYTLEANNLPLRINWVTQEGISRVCKINLFKVIFILAHHALGYTKKIKKSLKKISSNATYFLTGCALNIGQYAYYHYFFQIAKKQGIQEIAFSAPDIVAFAAVDVKIRTIFLQHGLLALSILFPTFDRIDVITVDEERYLKRLCNNSHIIQTNKESNKHKNDLIMILSPSRHEHVVEMRSFITWMVSKELKVVIRLTPKAPKEVVDHLYQDISHFILDDFSMPLTLSFEKWQPKFVASWTSTGLAIALQCESLPISLHDPIKGDEFWERLHPSSLDNMIYPMRNRVLFWPYDQEKIEMAMQSDNNYRNQILHLKSDQDCTTCRD